jgi:hypothetical protein
MMTTKLGTWSAAARMLLAVVILLITAGQSRAGLIANGGSDERVGQGTYAAIFISEDVASTGYLYQDVTTAISQDDTPIFDFGGLGAANLTDIQSPGGSDAYAFPGFRVLQEIMDSGTIPTTFTPSSTNLPSRLPLPALRLPM